MKFLKFLLTTVVIVGCIGYGIYYFGTNIASEHVMDAVSAELESSGQLEEIKQFINNDPELKQFVEVGANVDVSKLPFTTKEQATRVLIKKLVSVNYKIFKPEFNKECRITKFRCF